MAVESVDRGLVWSVAGLLGSGAVAKTSSRLRSSIAKAAPQGGKSQIARTGVRAAEEGGGHQGLHDICH